MTSPRELGEAFANALAGSTGSLRGLLTEDVEFTGPISATSGIVQTIAGLDEMAATITDLSIDVVLADEVTVLIWATVETRTAPATPTATWLTLRNGKVSEIKTVFALDGRER